MRTGIGILLLCLVGSTARAERVAMQLEWGFGATSSEMYWDGQVSVSEGQLASMQAVSFEADRHDRMTPPEFLSFTMGSGTDGMELVIEGDDNTTVGAQTLPPGAVAGVKTHETLAG